MRLSCILVAATALALLARGNALTVTSDKATGVSTMESPDTARVLEVENHAGAEKRSLRSHRVVDDIDDIDSIDDINDEEGEERRGSANLFASWKLDEMLSGVKEFKRYKNLKAYGYTPGTLQTKLENLYGTRYRDLWERYRANY
ncbi:hypothetical protein F444_23036 [Phytophthora nicotianae P1976]|uniref:RxLR effector protein n=2 Tax=Phytophthora nicotianae TaxID=4792 RepID=A0A080YW24_PHYNI|nr:hypothetical protein F444_23036 [Phytophthora nicotianae P1976]